MDTELKELRNFKANVTKLLFDDLGLPEGVQHNDRDLYDCIEGLRNLQTGFDEYDPEDGEYVKHHPSYKQLQDEIKELRKQHLDFCSLIETESGKRGLENLKLQKENDELKEQVEKLKETIDDTKEFLEVCDKNTDGEYHHYETRQIATMFEGLYDAGVETEEED